MKPAVCVRGDVKAATFAPRSHLRYRCSSPLSLPLFVWSVRVCVYALVCVFVYVSFSFILFLFRSCGSRTPTDTHVRASPLR